MTKEEIIDGLELYTVGRLKKDRVHITVEELQKFIDEIKSLEQEPTQINVIPKDYIYDTKTEDFVVYRHKYTGNEIHIKKPIPVYALEQKSSDDCIDRQEVKKFVEYIQAIKDNHNEKGSPINYGTICDIVINAHRLLDSPSVTPVQQWIPCSEKLPKDIGEYLVTISFDIGGKEPVRETRRNYFCSSKKWLHDNDEVIAWMLSPKPYGKESEE